MCVYACMRACCHTHQNPRRLPALWYLRKQCPDLARQQPFPYKLDYELSQNPAHLFQAPHSQGLSLTKSFSRWCLSSASFSISWACWSLASTSCCCRSLCLKTLSICCRKAWWEGPPVRSSLSQGGPAAADAPPSLPFQSAVLDFRVYRRVWAPSPWRVCFPTSLYFSSTESVLGEHRGLWMKSAPRKPSKKYLNC